MDIKLKSNDRSLNKRIFILVLGIVLLPIFLGLINKFLKVEEKYSSYEIGNEFSRVYKNIDVIKSYMKEQNLDMENAEKYIATNEPGLLKKIRQEVNIEFYCETEDPKRPVTNIENTSKDEFERETLAKYEDYIIIKAGDNWRKINCSESMGPVMQSAPSDESRDIYVRIANPLKYGDAIYDNVKIYNDNKIIGYIAIGMLALDLVIIIICIVSLLRDNKLVINEGYLQRIYKKLSIEVKALLLGSGIIMDIGFHILNTTYFKMFVYSPVIMIIVMVVGIIIGYLGIVDFLRMIQISKTGKLKEEIIKKSAIIRNYSLVKRSLILKTTGANIAMIVLGLTIYIMLIALTAWSIGKNTIDSGNMIFVVADIIVTVVILSYIVSIGKNINTIKLATDNIVKGNYKNDIEIKNCQVLKGIADNLINIESGLEVAVEKAVKSEKMKGELITNVSHDLRNPLTSIINYVDLLGKEDVSKEDREKYIQVLKEKSQRLKVLIEDLFEASKATSGAMEIYMENIDPVALLRQTIGEFEDKIESSGLQFIKKVPEGKVIAYADGGKTFRVFQNLISNILKYSMDNSRVYIEVKEEEEFIDIIFKNISKYELNFSEEEILERFKRGDSSRTTEGSGLGLAIAKSLVEIQGGSFKIEIDGDLFKVIVKLRIGN